MYVHMYNMFGAALHYFMDEFKSAMYEFCDRGYITIL